MVVQFVAVYGGGGHDDDDDVGDDDTTMMTTTPMIILNKSMTFITIMLIAFLLPFSLQRVPARDQQPHTSPVRIHCSFEKIPVRDSVAFRRALKKYALGRKLLQKLQPFQHTRSLAMETAVMETKLAAHSASLKIEVWVCTVLRIEWMTSTGQHRRRCAEWCDQGLSALYSICVEGRDASTDEVTRSAFSTFINRLTKSKPSSPQCCKLFVSRPPSFMKNK